MNSSRSSASKRTATDSTALLVLALEKFLSAAKSWSNEDLMGVLDGRFELTIDRTARRGGTSSKAADYSTLDVDCIRRDLGAMGSREDGFAYLDDLHLNRESLRKLASVLDLPVNRADRVEQIRERIVEGMIGYKLRSSAIRGTTSN